MASAIICADKVLEMETSERMEWVRGNESELLAGLSPLVREQSVLLDFSRVQRIDAAGLSALVALYREARSAGHSFAVRNPTPHVAEILLVVGLGRFLLAGEPEIGPRFGRDAA